MNVALVGLWIWQARADRAVPRAPCDSLARCPPMLRAVLFDMGGTLDGDGALARPLRPALRASRRRDAARALSHGFDDAEQRAATDAASLAPASTTLVRRHLSLAVRGIIGLRRCRLREA